MTHPLVIHNNYVKHYPNQTYQLWHLIIENKCVPSKKIIFFLQIYFLTLINYPEKCSFCLQMATCNWIITCKCGNPTEYNCNTCGENLCSDCKETHLQNDDTRHHSVVQYDKKTHARQSIKSTLP